jgi:sugar phosphate isomerase/epimerase
MSEPIKDFSKLCIHTITTKPWKLETALEKYAEHGVKGISVWQNVVEEYGATKVGEMIASYPIDVVSYVRGGFLPSHSKAERVKAIDHNKKLIEEAAAINAPQLVLVVGADPKQSMQTSRIQIQDGIEALIPFASEMGVQLTIEPLHPMYADTRSAINTLGQANTMAESINSDWVGIAVDVYHLWWDDNLEAEIKRCGANGNLYAYHICDWKVHPVDMLNDRGLMGEGCIDLPVIRSWVEAAGFEGYNEVEIFSNEYWAIDQTTFLEKIITNYKKYS